ncbi:MAG: UDP:flavonoid glycosyltransferase YjiC [Verrucomicrobia bacterium]|nr:MAG: UDP:flavonoid glycosyltransferase YjiC [Verrucomicrobiota bacterium]
MKIVYGVSGDGLGHVFEALEIARILQADGHVVKILTYGDRALNNLARFQPTRIEGVQLCFGPRGLSLWKTLRAHYRIFPFFFKNGPRLLQELNDFQPDVFITAYEPFTTFAAHRLRKPLISMDNQNELRHLTRPPGTNAFAFHLSLLATRVVTYAAAEYIVKSFTRRTQLPDRMHQVAPIIQQEIRRLTPTCGPHVLVYLTKENPELIAVLKSIDESFIVYCLNRVGEEQNLIFRRQGPTFLPDLRDCKAIIGTTGFSLIADSIYLKKPYFGVPLKKQFEQTHNAHFLADSGLGDYSETVTREQLVRFLAKLPDYRRMLAEYDLDPAEQEQTLRRLLAKLERQQAAVAAAGLTVPCL